jgi:hypothetical protein
MQASLQPDWLRMRAGSIVRRRCSLGFAPREIAPSNMPGNFEQIPSPAA